MKTDSPLPNYTAMHNFLASRCWDVTYHEPIKTLMETIRRMEDELIYLRKWQSNSIQSMAEWDQVWIAAGRPGTFGQTKAKATYESLFPKPQNHENIE